MTVAIIGFAISISCIVGVAVYLNKKINALDKEVTYLGSLIQAIDEERNKKIDALDEAVYQYMKEEHNSRVASGERSE